MDTEIVRINKDTKETLKDSVAEEAPFVIRLDSIELVTLYCSPTDLLELACGFLFCAGVLASVSDVEEWELDPERLTVNVRLKNKNRAPDLSLKRVYTPGCAGGVFVYRESDMDSLRQIKTDFTITSAGLFELMKVFQNSSVNYKKTGGVHSAGLSDGRELLIFKEDIGRHNALDKIIGEALFKNIVLRDKIILTSGRIFSDVIFKVAKAGSALVVSRSAPTFQAVRLARNIDLTLAGFARGQRLNIYSAPDRITL